MITPIKGFGVCEVDSIRLDPSGARGDRDFFMVSDEDRLLSISRTGAFASLTASLGDGGVLTFTRDGETILSSEVVDGPPVVANFYNHHEVPGFEVVGPFGELLSDVAGQRVRLVRCSEAGAGSDIQAATLLGTASVGELSRRIGRPVDSRRFRMLVEVQTSSPHEEEDWNGRILRGEDAALRMLGRVPRCAAVTRNPDMGRRDMPLVKELKSYRGMHDTEVGRGVCLGIYAEVAAPGELRLGEELQLQP